VIMLKKCIVIVLCLVLSWGLVVEASVPIRGNQITVNESGVFVSGRLVYAIGSEGYGGLISFLSVGFERDARLGFERFVGLRGGVTPDHVVLSETGSFLYRYSGRSVTAMPSGDINILGMVFRGDRGTRDWLARVVLPLAWRSIRSVADDFSINVNIPVLDGSMSFQDVVGGFRGLERRVYGVIKPFGDYSVGELPLVNLGGSHGVLLYVNYVATLSSAVEENGAFIWLDGNNYLHRLGVISSIKSAKSLDEASLADLSVSGDYVDFMTGNVVRLRDVFGSMFEVVGEKQTPENFVVRTLLDGVAVINTKYNEVVRIGDKSVRTGVIDIAGVLVGGSDVVLSSGGSGEFSVYVNEDGVVETSGGNIYVVSGKEPFDRVMGFLFSDKAKEQFSSREIESIISSIESTLLGQNRQSEWENLETQFGLGGNRVPWLGIVAGLVIIGVLVKVLFFKVRKKKQKLFIENEE